MRASPSNEKLRTAGGGDSAWDSHPVRAANRTAIAAATQSRNAAPSVLHGFIDQLLDGLLDALPFCRRLFQEHEEHVLLAVDHEITAAGAVPFEFSERAWRRWFCIPRIGADTETEPEAKTVAGEIEIIALHARPRPDMVRRHQLERFRADDLLALELSAIEDHLRKFRKVRHGGEHAAAAGRDRGDRLGHREDAENGVVGHRRLGLDVAHPEELVIDRLAVLLDQQDRAGNLLGRDFVAED